MRVPPAPVPTLQKSKMKLDTLIKLIPLLPKSPMEAKTTEELVTAYFKLAPEEDRNRPTHNTFIRRQIDVMEKHKMISYLPAVAKPGDRIKRSERYYVKEHSLLQYFMNSKVALNLIWANNVMKSLGPVFGLSDIDRTARGARLNQREKVLTERIRMVPDGIGRKYAHIEADILFSFVAAIQHNHSLMLFYRDRQGKPFNEIGQAIERTVLGLVAKDGTIYAITCLGSEDSPLHIPLHRVEKVQETGTRAYARPAFNIDDYVDHQHQLAHVLDDHPEPITMVLKVAPEAMFHFRERAFESVYGAQVVQAPRGADKRYTLTVKLPFTVQLPPFLWSHAGWVEVISPPELRTYVGERLLAAASYYSKDVKARFD